MQGQERVQQTRDGASRKAGNRSQCGSIRELRSPGPDKNPEVGDSRKTGLSCPCATTT